MDASMDTDELIELFPKYFTLALISVRNSGKSVLAQEIIKAVCKKKMVDVVIVMSGSAHLNDDYDFLPEGSLMNFDNGLLHKIWDKQMADKKDGKEKRIFIVFDDVLADKTAVKNEILQRIWIQGRHVSISSAILSQYPAFVLTPMIMGNSDLLLYSKLNRQNIEKLWMATVGISLKDFISISEKIAGVDYTFMVINNYCKSPEWRKYLSYVKVELKK
jgi:hypothetical protein